MQTTDNTVLIKTDSISVEFSLSNSASPETAKILAECLESSVKQLRSSETSCAAEADSYGSVLCQSTHGQSSGVTRGWTGKRGNCANGTASATSSLSMRTSSLEPISEQPKDKLKPREKKDKEEELKKTTDELRDVRLTALGVLNEAEGMYSKLMVL